MTNATYGYLPGVMNSTPAFNDLNQPLVSIPKDNNPDFTHHIPVNAGRAEKEAAVIWQTTFTPYPPIANAQQIKGRLGTYRAETTKADTSLLSVLDSTADEFDTTLDNLVTNRARHPFTPDEIDTAIRAVDADIIEATKTTGYFDHIIAQLNTKAAAKKFVAAVQNLGIDAFDQTAAANTNPQAYATMITEGKKLAILPHLMPYNLRATAKVAALFTDCAGLPTLTGKQQSRSNRVDVNFTETDVLEHAKALEGVRQADKLSTFLIALALNIYPGLSLNVATKWATITKREQHLAEVGLASISMISGHTEKKRVA